MKVKKIVNRPTLLLLLHTVFPRIQSDDVSFFLTTTFTREKGKIVEIAISDL